MERVRTVDPIQQVRDAAQAAGGVRSVRDVDRAQREVARFVGARPHPAVFVVDALPDIDPQWYGRIVLVRGGTGIADAAYILLRRANETLIWKRIDPDTSGTAPAVAALAAAGTGAIATVTGNDAAGLLGLTTGTGTTTGNQMTVTFAMPRANSSYAVMLTPADDDAAIRNHYIAARTGSVWTIGIAGTAPTASLHHAWLYFVVGF